MPNFKVITKLISTYKKMNHFTTNEWSLKTQEAGDGVWIFLPLVSTKQLTLSLLPTHIIGTSVETYYFLNDDLWFMLILK